MDTDGDGLTDTEEQALGTNPLLADSDRDGIPDGQEVLDGSNPLDRGSALAQLGSTLCAEWNGFLTGMWNILEHVNIGTTPLSVVNQLYSIDGVLSGESYFGISAGAQVDALVHDMSGYRRNSYGKICASHSGQLGDLDGRMLYYKTHQNPRTGLEFQFAFAMPFTNGMQGSQYVLFNTYQPSQRPRDNKNLVANWVQLTNLSDASASGMLNGFASDGRLLRQTAVLLAAGERRDFGAHEVGGNQVGYLEWIPTNPAQLFNFRNVRYLYSNIGNSDSFDSAFQLEGSRPTGERVAVPFDTTNNQMSVLEIANVLSQPVVASVALYDGATEKELELPIAPHSTFHLVINSQYLGPKRGLATVDADRADSVVVVAMQYGYAADAGLNYLYGVAATPPLGSVLRGSYNTNLEQNAWLVLLNTDSTDRSASLTLVRNNGQTVQQNGLPAADIQLAAKSIYIEDLRPKVGADDYGVVTVTPDQRNTVIGYVLRQRKLEFVIPTPLRQ